MLLPGQARELLAPLLFLLDCCRPCDLGAYLKAGLPDGPPLTSIAAPAATARAAGAGAGGPLCKHKQGEDGMGSEVCPCPGGHPGGDRSLAFLLLLGHAASAFQCLPLQADACCYSPAPGEVPGAWRSCWPLAVALCAGIARLLLLCVLVA